MVDFVIVWESLRLVYLVNECDPKEGEVEQGSEKKGSLV